MSPDTNQEERLLKKQIFILNRHLPRRRKTLKDLLDEPKPHVIGGDGIRHRFKNAELEMLSHMIVEDHWSRLKLPIYIEIEAETSGARVAGRLETRVVCEIIGKNECDDQIFIYRPEIRELRKKLPTTTQYMFLTR